jgi:cysteine peptidase C11 family protein
MSSVRTAATIDEQVQNDWTIMVFFAGDPHLSPSMTSQIKALKDAGFQKNTTVLVHYDPNEKGVGTTTFDINRQRKTQKGTIIGDGRDPFVRNLIEDSIPGVPKSATADQALEAFLNSAVEQHAAKHYLVFLTGHGMVVGNDVFLPDEHPETGVTLKRLGEILSTFSVKARDSGGAVELIGLHSCSMSAIEVAYELRGTAKYMMATEGVSFVASWPYRQLLKKLLNTVDEATTNNSKVDVDDLVLSIQRLSLHNSTDFMFSGLSADLCLCNLTNVEQMNAPLGRLTRALKRGLGDPRGLELITLAHLKAQSYWQETYTDLYDFCLCLQNQCVSDSPIQAEMAGACKDVIATLNESTRPESLIVQSDFFGPLFQYSHGLSIYFPWAKPIEDAPVIKGDDILGRYEKYAFTEVMKNDSWLSFLNAYFEATRRKSRLEEDQRMGVSGNGSKRPANIGGIVIGSTGISVAEALEPPKSSPPLGEGACTCSVKNYPMEFSSSPRAAQNPNPKEG